MAACPLGRRDAFPPLPKGRPASGQKRAVSSRPTRRRSAEAARRQAPASGITTRAPAMAVQCGVYGDLLPAVSGRALLASIRLYYYPAARAMNARRSYRGGSFS